MEFDPQGLKEKAQQKAKDNQAFLTRLRKKKPKDLDDRAHDLHDKVFEYTDCLTCANCCKSTQ